MYWGQLGPMLGAFLICAWTALRRQRFTAAGILLVPLMLKAHLLLVPIALLAVVSLRNQRYTVIVAVAGVALALVAASFLIAPDWLPRWREQGAPITSQTFSLFDTAVARLGDSLQWLQGAGLVAGVAAVFFRYRKLRSVPPHILGEATLLTAFFSPYLWYHDLSNLLPCIVWVASILWTVRGGPLLIILLGVVNGWAMHWYLPGPPFVLRYLIFATLLVIAWRGAVFHHAHRRHHDLPAGT
jgi:hypothetical protein